MASAPSAVLSPPGEPTQPDPQPIPGLSPIQDSFTQAEPARKSLDVWMLTGVLIAIAGTIAGIKSTGVSLLYFFQPAGALIVIGGTFGIALITTPRSTLQHSVRRVMGILRSETANREDLIEEIVSYAKLVRMKGLVSIEQKVASSSNSFLRDTVRLAMDVHSREELQGVLETK